MSDIIPEFHYRVSWRSHRAIPGHHASTQLGGGFEFHGHAALIAYPDPRKLDIHASLNEPFGQFLVRTFRQRSAISVYVIADCSASMNFSGAVSRHDVLTRFCVCAAHSVYRTGDLFGFFGCGETILDELSMPLRRYKGVAEDLSRRLLNHTPKDRSALGLLDSPTLLARKRSLVFLVSDFHFPLAMLEQLLEKLDHHDLVPVVLQDSREQSFPARGLLRIADAESGKSRMLLLRPSLRARIQAEHARRRDEIIAMCTRFGRAPHFVIDAFDADQMTGYFLQ